MNPQVPDKFDEIMAASIPSTEELDAMEAERIARQSHPEGYEKTLQNTTKLSLWLPRCAKAGIPYVPAKFSPEIATQEILHGPEENYPTPQLDAAVKWLTKHYQPKTMWRWDECAPEELKYALSSGQDIPFPIELCVDDPRIFDILFTINSTVTALCVRPLIHIEKHNNYPVEFRCYVDENGVAVSNYYPQIDLPENYRPLAEQAGELALKLRPTLAEEFTADFAVTHEKKLVFLEGGPGWNNGAHPCCFNPMELKAGRILLKREPGNVID